MKIGVDIDGVIADYSGGILRWIEQKRYKRPGHYAPPPDWEFSGYDFGTTVIKENSYCHPPRSSDYRPKTLKDWHLEFTDIENRGYLKLHPMPWAVWGVAELARLGHSVHFVTNRGACIEGKEHDRKHQLVDTIQWLQDHGFGYNEITFTNDKTKIQCDLYIEDSPHNLRAYQAAELPTLVYTHAYNEDIALEGSLLGRSNNWPNIIGLVKEFEA